MVYYMILVSDWLTVKLVLFTLLFLCNSYRTAATFIFEQSSLRNITLIEMRQILTIRLFLKKFFFRRPRVGYLEGTEKFQWKFYILGGSKVIDKTSHLGTIRGLLGLITPVYKALACETRFLAIFRFWTTKIFRN